MPGPFVFREVGKLADSNRFCLEVALDSAFVNADTLSLNERRSGTRFVARKQSAHQVPASFNGLLITKALLRATFQTITDNFAIFPTM